MMIKSIKEMEYFKNISWHAKRRENVQTRIFQYSASNTSFTFYLQKLG